METIECFTLHTEDDQQAKNSILNLSNMNDDCKEFIFEHLDWQDLLSIADTNKQLYSAACRVFKRKYGNAKISLGTTGHLGY